MLGTEVADPRQGTRRSPKPSPHSLLIALYTIRIKHLGLYTWVHVQLRVYVHVHMCVHVFI
jgi:hypothetical protein